MVLESISTAHQKVIYVIDFDKCSKLLIGRGNTSHIRINEISVSWTHAYFYKFSGQVYLVDNKSKFGTLALVKTPI